MNGFSYDEEKKTIRVSDGTYTVFWEGVEKDIGKEASKMYADSKSIDDFLIKHNCKRIWG